MSTRARTSRHDEQSEKKDVRHASICRCLRRPEITNGRINEPREIAEETGSHRFHELPTSVYPAIM